jgi:hypothetical protein
MKASPYFVRTRRGSPGLGARRAHPARHIFHFCNNEMISLVVCSVGRAQRLVFLRDQGLAEVVC